MLEVLFHIIQYSLPALVVFLLMRQFLKGQLLNEQIKSRGQLQKDTLALRIQAYERLVLFCERIDLSSLLLRLNTPETRPEHLKHALMVSVQKEFEHNLTQQIYVSSELWQMISLLKEKTIASISQVDGGQVNMEKDDLVDQLVTTGNALSSTIGTKVKAAIRKELEIYFQ